MPRGGARVRSGPPPDPAALRRDRGTDGEWLVLPARHDGPAPDWPLLEASDRELELWSELWRKGQAAEWARRGLELEVALYVRRFVEAERPMSAVALTTVVRQLGDALGLTVPGARANRWVIAEDELAVARAAELRQAGRPAASSAKTRLRAVVDANA